jgi:hypothetical protein
MSLNRLEQLTYDYVHAHPEELRHWQASVRREAAREPDKHEAARRLEGDLWRYVEERSAVARPFKEEAARPGGLRRTSLRNLAELLLRLWVEPKPGAKKAGGGGAASAPKP